MLAVPALHSQISHLTAKREFDAIILTELDLPTLSHSVIKTSVMALKQLLKYPDCANDSHLHHSITSEIDLYEYFIANSICFLL
jgi:hypothetical protein